MASTTDRFADILRTIGASIARAGDAMRPNLKPSQNPQQVAPSVVLPGVSSHWGSTPSNENDELTRALHTVEAYFGRLSFDAGPSITRFSSFPATDLTPEKIVGAQQEAIAGYPLRWAEMIEQILSRDSHLSGIGQQRVDDVIKGSWRLVRSGEDTTAQGIRNFCDQIVREIDEFEDGMAWLLWGNAYSYNACETTWKRQQLTFPGPKGEVIGPVDVIVPGRVDPVHAKHFRFDLRTDEPYLWLGSDQISLPYGKFLFYRGEGQHPITERRGYMWQCVWLSMFRSMGLAGWATWIERFGQAIPIIEHDGNLAQFNEFKHLYQDLLNAVGTGKGAVYPVNHAKLRLEPPPSGGGKASDPHSAFADMCDAAQSVRVLGATLTAKIGNVGSFAASSAHLEVKYAKEEADARRLWKTIRRQLIEPIVRINANELAAAMTDAGYACTPDMLISRVPKGFHRVPREVDPKQRAEIIALMRNQVGVRIGMEALYDEFDLPQPVNEADVAPGEPTPVTSGGKVVSTDVAAHEGAEAPKEASPTAPQAEPEAADEDEDDETDTGRAQFTLSDAEAVIMTVDEARALRGLPALGGDAARMTIAEYRRKLETPPPALEPKTLDPQEKRLQQLSLFATNVIELRKGGIKFDISDVARLHGVDLNLTDDSPY